MVECGTGEEGEVIAYEFLKLIFDKVRYDPYGHSDFICNKKGVNFYVEVKSCLDKVMDMSHNNHLRGGRFFIKRAQHNYLKQFDNSYYLFIEFDNDMKVKIFFFFPVVKLELNFNNYDSKVISFKSVIEVDD